MQQHVFIPHRLAGLNELLGATNQHRQKGAKLKKQETELVALYARRLKPYDKPIVLSVVYHEPNAKRDPDNIAAAKKFILDGLVDAGVLPNDTQKWVRGFSDRWVVDKDHVGVSITIKEDEGE